MAIVDWPIEQLKVYKPKFTRERDFDKFWKETKSESAKQPMNVKIEYEIRRRKC